MLTEDTKIYRSMYKLLMLLITARGAFDKPFKYIVGDKMVERARKLIRPIY